MNEPTMETLARRLDRVERENRRLKQAGVVALTVIAAVVLLWPGLAVAIDGTELKGLEENVRFFYVVGAGDALRTVAGLLQLDVESGTSDIRGKLIWLDKCRMRQWTWTSDMTGDGIVTILDVWAWAPWLFFYPGDLAIYYILSAERFAQFFQLTPAHCGGAVSGVISLVVWFILGGSALGVFYKFRDRSLHQGGEG